MESSLLLLVRELTRTVERRLLSPAQFDFAIDQLTKVSGFPFAAINYKIESSNLSVGSIGEGPPATTHAIALGSGLRHQRAQLSVWTKNFEDFESVDPIAALPLLENAFASWWMKDRRSPKGDLLFYSPEVRQKCESAFQLARAEKSEFCVLFMDLDNFKTVNEQMGHAGGDKVIRTMAGFLEAQVKELGVLIHFGGDEFLAVLPDARTDVAIAFAIKLLSDAKSFDFGAGSVHVGISIGMATTIRSAAGTFEAFYNESNQTLMNLVKHSAVNKGSVRMSGEDPVGLSSSIPYDVLALTLRTGLGLGKNKRVFENDWINALLFLARERCAAGLSIALISEELKAWHALLKVDPSAKVRSTVPFLGLSCLNVSIPEIDLISVAARLILENSFQTGQRSGEIKVVFTAIEATIVYGSVTQMTVSNPGTVSAGTVSLGVPSIIASQVEQVSSAEFFFEPSHYILVEVGHSAVRTLSRLAAEHVVIDDRPVRGGGLPDFWELAISRIITRLAELPNVKKIVILNPSGESYETTGRLLNPNDWDIDYYHYKCAVPKELIVSARDRIRDSVSIHLDEIDALRSLTEVYKAPMSLTHGKKSMAAAGIMLLRELQDANISLRIEDGCRVETAERAYPIVLEIIRKNSIDDVTITDQDGEKLRELTDFKIVLTTPTDGRIPRFFSSDEETARLEQYFENEFLSEKGRFGSAFKLDGAWDRVLAHVAWSVTTGSRKPFSTRRAILVLPHTPDSSPGEVAPLGLVAVRLLPQPHGNEIVLNISFTWRTVEALIGLPYSLYGSIRLSETARDQLTRLTGRKVRLGFLSYVANSLHFFMSSQCQLIARQIVNESSD